MNRPAVRIAMWSGPRNISTAMMRSFGARNDCFVVDEPFYAVYLAATGLLHPMREQVLAAQPQNWRVVIEQLLAPLPKEGAIQYQKQMTHHMLPSIDREWLASCRNAFLIRDPSAVLASYVQKRAAVTLSDIGIAQQVELFEREADRLGEPPPVIDGADVLAAPGKVLTRLCEALGIDFQPAMLHWPPGPRATDGVWAPAWYHAVEQSTCFAPAAAKLPTKLSAAMQRIADQARPGYEMLSRYKLDAP